MLLQIAEEWASDPDYSVWFILEPRQGTGAARSMFFLWWSPQAPTVMSRNLWSSLGLRLRHFQFSCCSTGQSQLHGQAPHLWNRKYIKLVPNRERSPSRLYIVTLLISLICRVHHEKNARLEEAQAGIKIAGRNINILRYADDTTLMAESEEELKSLLMKVKEESDNLT